MKSIDKIGLKLKEKMLESVVEETDKREMKIVKKNYLDSTSGVIYSLGCSLVHFTLFVV